MNPRDPRNRRNRGLSPLHDAATRLEQAADEYRAQVVRLPVDSEEERPGATEWVVPKHLPPVPAVPVLEELVDHDESTELTPELARAVLGGRPDVDDDYAPLHAAPERVFGWASRHDDRSLAFAVRDRLAHRVPLQTVLRPIGPILDQGTHPPLSLHDASACTGFAGVAAANSLHGTALGEVEARELYALAQKRDQVSGENYNGAPILGVMKAGQELGYWAGYWWCLGTRDLAQALMQFGPVILGVQWSEQLLHPDPRGLAAPGGADLGGHAILCFGLRTDLPGGPHFGLQQSYGTDVGNHGVLWVQHKHLASMLAGRGEAALPLTDQQLAEL